MTKNSNRTSEDNKPKGGITGDGKPEAPHQTTLLQDIWFLLKKILAIAIVFLLLFTLLFGIFRYEDDSMTPSIKGGDLVLYYRIDKQYAAEDCIVLNYKGRQLAGRVVALPGDTVDITKDGLVINGATQIEDGITSETLPYKGGISYPLKVGKGEVFVLGDNRENATDSRIYGPVKTKDTKGTIMTLIRRRGI